jgi:phage-related protein
MSVATGQEMPKAAVTLGKALNDPVRGISALTRVGVTFTDAQKKTITALAESGKSMEAQKIILAELNKEFGGSAEALGNTLPGRINVLRQTFSNFAGELVASLVPALERVVTWATVHGPEIEAVMRGVFERLGAAVRTAAGVFQEIVSAGSSFAQFLREHETTATAFAAGVAALATGIGAYVIASKAAAIATGTWAAAQAILNAALAANPIGAVIIGLAALAGGLVVAYQRSETFRSVVQRALDAARVAFDAVKTAAVAVADHLRGPLAVAADAARVAFAAFRQGVDFVRAAIDFLMPVIRLAAKFYEAEFKLAVGVAKVAIDAFKTGLDLARSAANTLLAAGRSVATFLEAGWETAVTAAKAVADGFEAAISAVKTALNAVKTAGTAVVNFLGAAWRAAWSAADSALAPVRATLDGLASVLDRIIGLASSAAGAIERVASVAGKLGGIAGAVGSILPGKAAGGPVLAGHAYIVGEKGPEVFVPSFAGTIVPKLEGMAPALASMAAGPVGPLPVSRTVAAAAGDGINVTVHVHGSVVTEGELVRKVRDGFNEALRANPRLGTTF